MLTTVETREIEDQRSEESYRQLAERIAPTPGLVKAFDNLFESPDFLIAIGKATIMPSGIGARYELDEHRRVFVEKNGVTWMFEPVGRRSITKITTQVRPVNDLYGQMSFHDPTIEVHVGDYIDVDPGNVMWKRQIHPFSTSAEDLRPDSAWNSPKAVEKAWELINAYNAPESTEQTASQVPPEATLFVIDEGRMGLESEFVSLRQRVEQVVAILEKDPRVYQYYGGVMIRRSGDGKIYVEISTQDMSHSDEELLEWAKSFKGVDVRFNENQYSRINRKLGILALEHLQD